MRRVAARVCLVAGLGMFFPALPTIAEVLVLTRVAPAHTAVAAASLSESKPASEQAAPPDPAVPDIAPPSELLMLVVGLAVIGLVTLRRS